jgi:hypothetical protein
VLTNWIKHPELSLKALKYLLHHCLDLHQKGFATREETIVDEEFCYKHFKENICSKPSNDLQIVKKKCKIYISVNLYQRGRKSAINLSRICKSWRKIIEIFCCFNRSVNLHQKERSATNYPRICKSWRKTYGDFFFATIDRWIWIKRREYVLQIFEQFEPHEEQKCITQRKKSLQKFGRFAPTAACSWRARSNHRRRNPTPPDAPGSTSPPRFHRRESPDSRLKQLIHEPLTPWFPWRLDGRRPPGASLPHAWPCGVRCDGRRGGGAPPRKKRGWGAGEEAGGRGVGGE